MPRWSVCEKQACPRCGSEETVRCGRRKDGKQLWLCQGCKRRFTVGACMKQPLNARLTREGTYRCPRCRATRTCLAGRTARGTRILKCHECGKRTAVVCVDVVEEGPRSKRERRCAECGIVFSVEFPRSVENPKVCAPCFVKAPLSQWAMRAGLDKAAAALCAIGGLA